MQLTISSLLISLCLSTILIFLLDLSIKKHFFTIIHLQILIFLIILTMYFPFELILNKSIVVPYIMNPIDSVIKPDLSGTIPKISVFLFIYLIGVLYRLILFIKDIIFIHKKYLFLVNNSNKCFAQDFLPNSKKNYIVYLSDFVSTPSIIGFNKTIFIPYVTFNKQELSNILEHEIAHINHHDIFIKFIINILTIIYWWFYPVYIFQKHSNLVLEIRTDHFVTKDKNKASKMKYAQTLIDVQKKILNNQNRNKILFNSNIIDSNTESLKHRIQYLSYTSQHNFIPKIFLVLLIFSSVSIHCISLKNYYHPPVKREYFTKDNLNELNISSEIYEQTLSNSLSPTSKETEWIFVNVEGHIYKRLWNTETGYWEKKWQFVL